MKMEVVLSAPGSFSNDSVPFKNEEIREWSRVDRLTGMLERARIETGRWRTSNDASMHSYGKFPQVTDLRERNSADGAVMQKAKRQVEIFQSKEPGRSVQVFRASQWSSSRITDGNVKNIIPNDLKDSMVNGTSEMLNTNSWNFPTLTFPSVDKISLKSNDSDAFEENKDLLLTGKNEFEKYLLPKRSNSDDDLSSFIGSDASSRNSSLSFARDCKSRRSLQIPSGISVSIPNYDGLKSDIVNKEIYSSISPDLTGNCTSSYNIEDQRKLNDYGSLNRNKSPVVTSSPQHSRLSTAIRPNAITVVNLMQPELYQDNLRNKKSSIVTLRSLPVHPDESTIKSRKQSITKTNSSGDESGVNLPNRAVKKVGFCKTEVHFAADSGKVNIVETDGKPPPTNKFRRRRRNQNQIGTSGNFIGKSVDCGNGNVRPIQQRQILKSEISDNEEKNFKIDNDCSGAYCVVDLETKKFWANPDVNPKLHMTTVNFGKLDKRLREHDELKNADELTSPKVVSEVLTRKCKGPEGNIITTDSENNRVLSTIVTTHESTVARVEDTRLNRKKLTECRTKSPSTKKKNESKIVLSVDTTDKGCKNLKNSKSNCSKETPVYVNVFKIPDDHYPIYENYRVDNTKEKLIPIINKSRDSSGLKSTLEKKRSKAKSPNKLGKRSPVSLSRLSSSSRTSGKSQHDSIKTKAIKKSTANGETTKSIGKSNFINSELTKGKKTNDIHTGSTKSKRVPMEVVYRTAVFNMKNEKLSKPVKEKDTKAPPRSINDLICGSRTNRINNSKRKSSISSQSSTKGAPQTKKLENH